MVSISEISGVRNTTRLHGDAMSWMRHVVIKSHGCLDMLRDGRRRRHALRRLAETAPHLLEDVGASPGEVPAGTSRQEMPAGRF